jgi:hypothetical protein
MTRWNIIKTMEQGEEIYRDYEGFYSEETTERVTTLVLTHVAPYENIRGNIPKEMLLDITANLLVEFMEYDEDTPLESDKWDDRTIHLIHAVYEMLQTREWTKSGINWEDEAIARGLDINNAAPKYDMRAQRLICPFCMVEVEPGQPACEDCKPKQLPGYHLCIAEGDLITITAGVVEVTGTVSTAHYYNPDRDREGRVQGGGWYIELIKANTPGGVSYWKQGIDGGKVTMINGIPIR